jgi:hypothetical protein
MHLSAVPLHSKPSVLRHAPAVHVLPRAHRRALSKLRFNLIVARKPGGDAWGDA